jgi:hypothetical protein
MSERPSNPAPADLASPVSSFAGPIAELIAHRMLKPPSRPGMLAAIDRFEVLRIIGGGGMGIVLLARDVQGGHEVAIKMIKPELAAVQQMTHRFIKEVSHMQRLRHKSIVPVLEISNAEDCPYLVMPYFEKGNLASCIRPGRALNADLILDVALQIAEGLQFAHESGIIHRDLKPANILMSAEGRACLSDFGLARTVFNDTLVDVESQQVEGTAPYLSPAVALGQAEDTRCDIYAFGALLYEMLTGEPPYKGQSTREIRNKIIAGPPLAIRALNPGADAPLIVVAEGAMGRELRDRYANMADIVADLQGIKENKAPVGPHGLRRRVRRRLTETLRPSHIIIALLVTAGVAIVFGLALSKHRTRPQKVPSAVVPSAVVPSAVVPSAVVPSAVVPSAVVSTAVANGRSVEPPTRPILFEKPCGVAVDSAGNVYVVDSDAYTLSRITPTGQLSLLAGQLHRPGIADGAGGSGLFSLLRAVATDESGSVIISDGCRIRKLSRAGAISTLAGAAGKSGSDDGPSKLARFDRPSGLCADADGNVYAADTYAIRRVTSEGVVSTLAGTLGHSGNVDGPGDGARFSDQAKGLAIDGMGDLIVADSLNSTIRKITRDGVVSTLAGAERRSGSIDGSGKTARFFRPCGVAVDHAGRIYVADSFNHTIREITPAGLVRTVAGLAGQPGNEDGPASQARFNYPVGVAVDDAGDIFAADMGNRRIRKISPGGWVSTLGVTP